MAGIDLGGTQAAHLVRFLSLRQLYWVTGVLPLAFAAAHQ